MQSFSRQMESFCEKSLGHQFFSRDTVTFLTPAKAVPVGLISVLLRTPVPLSR